VGARQPSRAEVATSYMATALRTRVWIPRVRAARQIPALQMAVTGLMRYKDRVIRIGRRRQYRAKSSTLGMSISLAAPYPAIIKAPASSI